MADTNPQQIRVKKLTPTAQLPKRATALSAGADLYSDGEDVLISPWTRALISTGVSIALPEASYGRVAPRSGLAVRGLDIAAGVIDCDYRGEVKVLLVNNSPHPFTVTPGLRIAQLIVERMEPCGVQEVPALDATDRGAHGFGSTGE
jgi:deoxyuridine 5'-triphosphate nucleotidohydrolase